MKKAEVKATGEVRINPDIAPTFTPSTLYITCHNFCNSWHAITALANNVIETLEKKEYIKYWQRRIKTLKTRLAKGKVDADKATFDINHFQRILDEHTDKVTSLKKQIVDDLPAAVAEFPDFEKWFYYYEYDNKEKWAEELASDYMKRYYDMLDAVKFVISYAQNVAADIATTAVEIEEYAVTPEDDGSNDEPEEDFLATLDTSVDEDAEDDDELIDEPEPNSDNIAEVEPAEKWHYYGYDYHCIPYYLWSHKFIYGGEVTITSPEDLRFYSVDFQTRDNNKISVFFSLIAKVWQLEKAANIADSKFWSRAESAITTKREELGGKLGNWRGMMIEDNFDAYFKTKEAAFEYADFAIEYLTTELAKVDAAILQHLTSQIDTEEKAALEENNYAEDTKATEETLENDLSAMFGQPEKTSYQDLRTKIQVSYRTDKNGRERKIWEMYRIDLKTRYHEFFRVDQATAKRMLEENGWTVKDFVKADKAAKKAGAKIKAYNDATSGRNTAGFAMKNPAKIERAAKCYGLTVEELKAILAKVAEEKAQAKATVAESITEDDGSNDEVEEDFLETLDTSVDEDAEDDELIDEPEPNSDNIAEVESAEKWHYYGYDYHCIPYYLWSHKFIYGM